MLLLLLIFKSITNRVNIYVQTEPSAYNFNIDAGVDDGSCIAYQDLIVGCINQDYLEYNSSQLYIMRPYVLHY